MSLSANIKRLRLEKDMTQEQLVQSLAYPRKQYLSGKQAKRTPTVRFLFLLLMSLRCLLTSYSETKRLLWQIFREEL